MTWKTWFIFLFVCFFVHSFVQMLTLELGLFLVLAKSLTPCTHGGFQLQNVGTAPACPALLGGCPHALWGKHGLEQQAGGEKISW